MSKCRPLKNKWCDEVKELADFHNPEASGLGWEEFARLIAGSPLPVLALVAVTGRRAQGLMATASGLCGLQSARMTTLRSSEGARAAGMRARVAFATSRGFSAEREGDGLVHRDDRRLPGHLRALTFHVVDGAEAVGL